MCWEWEKAAREGVRAGDIGEDTEETPFERRVLEPLTVPGQPAPAEPAPQEAPAEAPVPEVVPA
jgi:hypothetical protein